MIAGERQSQKSVLSDGHSCLLSTLFHPDMFHSFFSPGNIGKLLGPLPMHPAAEDNYGYDACAILCLPCVPNILVIATESGMLYHCVVLEGEEEDDQTVSQASVDSLYL